MCVLPAAAPDPILTGAGRILSGRPLLPSGPATGPSELAWSLARRAATGLLCLPGGGLDPTLPASALLPPPAGTSLSTGTSYPGKAAHQPAATARVPHHVSRSRPLCGPAPQPPHPPIPDLDWSTGVSPPRGRAVRQSRTWPETAPPRPPLFGARRRQEARLRPGRPGLKSASPGGDLLWSSAFCLNRGVGEVVFCVKWSGIEVPTPPYPESPFPRVPEACFPGHTGFRFTYLWHFTKPSPLLRGIILVFRSSNPRN